MSTAAPATTAPATTQRPDLFFIVKRKPGEVVPIGNTVPEARAAGRTSRRVYVTRTLLHVVGEFDVVDWPEVILCRFMCDETPAPAHEAVLFTHDMLDAMIEAVDKGRAKVAAGLLTERHVAEMERRAEAIIEAMGSERNRVR